MVDDVAHEKDCCRDQHDDPGSLCGGLTHVLSGCRNVMTDAST